jgi:hypothetical protein
MKIFSLTEKIMEMLEWHGLFFKLTKKWSYYDLHLIATDFRITQMTLNQRLMRQNKKNEGKFDEFTVLLLRQYGNSPLHRYASGIILSSWPQIFVPLNCNETRK